MVHLIEKQHTAEQAVPAVQPYAWVILWVVYLASVAAPLNQFKVPPILPSLAGELGLTLTQAGTLMSSIALVGLALALPAGMILQRLGPKLTGLLSLGSIAAGSVIGALSGSVEILIASRLMEGLGMGLMAVIAPATIAMWFPRERQGGPMGIWATWVPVGMLVIFNLAPAMTAALGWRSVWWLGAGYTLLIMVAFGLLVRRPPDLEHETSHAEPRPSMLQALKNRDIWLLGLNFTCFNLASIGLSTYYPTFLNEVRGFPLIQASFLASIATMVVLGSAPLAGWLSDRIGTRRLLFSLPFLAFSVFLLFPFKVTGWQQVVIVMAFQGLLLGIMPSVVFAAAPELMRRPELAGLGLAVVMVGQYAGQLIGPVLFADLVSRLGWAPAAYGMIPFCLIGFISGWLVRIR